MRLGTFLAAAAIAGAAILASAGAAFAASAEATTAVNVRAGPGAGHSKVDVLFSGENVDVRQCRSGWCYVVHSGPDGWVSDRYLARTNTGGTTNGGSTSGASGGSAAYTAQATAAVNVRTGPGLGNSRVDALYTGETVTVRECRSNWCYVDHSGRDGWVAARYLSRTGVATGGSSGGSSNNDGRPDVNFHFGIGPDGPNFGISVGDQQNQQPNTPPSQRARACFFSGDNYTGRNFCVEPGNNLTAMPSGWNDRISSVRLIGDVGSVTMCKHAGYRGFCRTSDRNEPSLGPYLNDEISSLKVR